MQRDINPSMCVTVADFKDCSEIFLLRPNAMSVGVVEKALGRLRENEEGLDQLELSPDSAFLVVKKQRK